MAAKTCTRNECGGTGIIHITVSGVGSSAVGLSSVLCLKCANGTGLFPALEQCGALPHGVRRPELRDRRTVHDYPVPLLDCFA